MQIKATIEYNLLYPHHRGVKLKNKNKNKCRRGCGTLKTSGSLETGTTTLKTS